MSFRHAQGIFRPGVPAIIGLSAEPSIRSLLAQQAGRALWVGDEHLDSLPLALMMRGSHQRRNAACAYLAALTLRAEQGGRIDGDHIAEGLAAATLPGRIQEVQPGLWIDGAHNVQAAQALATVLDGEPKKVLVVGLSNTKDIAGFLAPLRRHAVRLIATAGRGDRAHPAAKVGEVAMAVGFETVDVVSDSARAIAMARALDFEVLVTSSLLLLGEVLSDLGAPGADPIVVTDPGEAKR